MHTIKDSRPRRRFARVLPTVAVAAAAVLVGTTGAQASTPRDVATVAVAGTTSAVRAASTWEFAGYYPDPLLCHLSGIASGRPYTCNFIFVGWTLWLRTS